MPELLLLTLLLVGTGVFVWARRRRLPGYRPSVSGFPLIAFVVPTTVFVLTLAVLNGRAEVMFVTTLLSITMLFVLVWLREFVGLMGLSDEAFPGRYDKFLWFALMILLPPVGLVSFIAFRRAYWPVEKPVKGSVSDLL